IMEDTRAPYASAIVADDPQHPFFPVHVKVPGYVALSTPPAVLLTIFFGGLAGILATSKISLKRSHPTLSNGEVWTASWFILCGFIHLFFEGYFSYHSLDMGSRTDLFGQLWKEYALSDSRYMTRDSFVVCLESVTAYLWGPLSFLCAYYITIGHSIRHPLQLIISLGQLYGLILYYGTCAFEELVHGVILSRPEQFYYCVYYVLCNAFWLFIPGYLIYQSVQETSKAFA
ncbi:3-beta-hydroxysteroid-Delta(8),Delta(7)-isomerase, partial [Dactylonectria estremocensis]